MRNEWRWSWVVFAFGFSAIAEQPRELVQQAVQTEVAADAADHSRWLYYDMDKKPGNSVTQWVAQTANGDLERVLEKNGAPVSRDEQRSKMEALMHDDSEQAKRRKNSKQDDKRANDMLRMLPDAFVWTETGRKNDETILHFTPDPKFDPPSWEARVFAAMEGDMTVSNAQHRIVSLKGRMIREVKFAGGLFGSIQPGGTFNVERRQMPNGAWQITETHVDIRGHVLIFKSISEHEDEVKSRFQALPPEINFQQAEEKLLAQEK